MLYGTGHLCVQGSLQKGAVMLLLDQIAICCTTHVVAFGKR